MQPVIQEIVSALGSYRSNGPAKNSVSVGATVLAFLLDGIDVADTRGVVRVLPPCAAVDTPACVDASNVSHIVIRAPVYVCKTPGATIEHVIVQLDPRDCVATMLPRSIMSLAPSRLDIRVSHARFVVTMLEYILADTPTTSRRGCRDMHVRVYGSSYLCAYVSAMLLHRACVSTSFVPDETGLRWCGSNGIVIDVCESVYRSPSWLFRAVSS